MSDEQNVQTANEEVADEVQELIETVEDADDAPRRSGGDKRMVAFREALDMLIGAVELDRDDVDEYTVLGDIAVRAGLMWRCINNDCRCLNHTNNGNCDNCNKRRPRLRETPKADPWG